MFVINALMDDTECTRIRRHLHERGILVCDLNRPVEADPDHRRWLVGTFGLATVLMTLSNQNVSVLYTDRAQPLEIREESKAGIELSVEEQIDLYGAERVCRTDSYKGSLVIAMTANEIGLMEPNVRNPGSPLLGQIIERLGDQDAQWLTCD